MIGELIIVIMGGSLLFLFVVWAVLWGITMALGWAKNALGGLQ